MKFTEQERDLLTTAIENYASYLADNEYRSTNFSPYAKCSAVGILYDLLDKLFPKKKLVEKYVKHISRVRGKEPLTPKPRKRHKR